MKTSTKLLTILFIGIPVALFIYNWLLKEQYAAGKLEEVKYVDVLEDRLLERDVPAFKYLVIDGALRSGKSKDPGPYVEDWSMNITILNVRDNQKQKIKVNKLYANMLQTRINNDTLFVSFYRNKRISNFPSRWYNRLLTIQTPNNVNSITSRNGNYTIQSFISNNFKLISGEGSSVTFDNSTFDRLEIIARDRQVSISANNKVKELYYSLSNDSRLDIDDTGKNISKFMPGRIDTSATISLTGKALRVHKYMTR